MIGGLYDYGARFYDPLLGRFLSADTVVPGAGNPQALNRYAYVLNNPLRYTDPSGYWVAEEQDDPVMARVYRAAITAMTGAEVVSGDVSWSAAELNYVYQGIKDMPAGTIIKGNVKQVVRMSQFEPGDNGTAGFYWGLNEEGSPFGGAPTIAYYNVAFDSELMKEVFGSTVTGHKMVANHEWWHPLECTDANGNVVPKSEAERGNTPITRAYNRSFDQDTSKAYTRYANDHGGYWNVGVGSSIEELAVVMSVWVYRNEFQSVPWVQGVTPSKLQPWFEQRVNTVFRNVP